MSDDTTRLDAKPEVTPQAEEPSTAAESLPSLASIFKPEEFFEMDPVEETSLSRLCCYFE